MTVPLRAGDFNLNGIQEVFALKPARIVLLILHTSGGSLETKKLRSELNRQAHRIVSDSDFNEAREALEVAGAATEIINGDKRAFILQENGARLLEVFPALTKEFQEELLGVFFNVSPSIT